MKTDSKTDSSWLQVNNWDNLTKFIKPHNTMLHTLSHWQHNVTDTVTLTTQCYTHCHTDNTMLHTLSHWQHNVTHTVTENTSYLHCQIHLGTLVNLQLLWKWQQSGHQLLSDNETAVDRDKRVDQTGTWHWLTRELHLLTGTSTAECCRQTVHLLLRLATLSTRQLLYCAGRQTDCLASPWVIPCSQPSSALTEGLPPLVCHVMMMKPLCELAGPHLHTNTQCSSCNKTSNYQTETLQCYHPKNPLKAA